MSNLNPKFVSVSEDTVECKFFSLQPLNFEHWKDLQTRLQNYINELSSEYIWHKEQFEVTFPVASPDLCPNDLTEHLHSSTQVGDNIEDEWFIVYLIIEISKLFNDIIIQINDSDGEFLLIEAADYLPKWLNPESAENRPSVMNILWAQALVTVNKGFTHESCIMFYLIDLPKNYEEKERGPQIYIYQGYLHIIPTSMIDLGKNIIVKDAINFIVKYTNETKSSIEVDNVVKQRLVQYPQKIQTNIHRAVVNLPVNIAALLSVKPNLISSIVHAYCNKDIYSKKLGKTVDLQETVDTTVTFTKCLYAMLVHSKTSICKINKPKKFDLGTKLNIGYNILLGKSADIFSTEQWNKFIKNLKNTGYFKANLEGSKDYVQLFETAKQYFISNECSENMTAAHEIKQLLESEQYKNQVEHLKNISTCLIDDNDDWLNIHPNQLEDILSSRYGKQAKFSDKDVITPETISNNLSRFLKEPSDFEGIETNHNDNVNDDKIDFDANMFSEIVDNILDSIVPEDNDSLTSDFDFSEDEVEGDTLQDIELKTSLISLDTNSDSLLNFKQSIREEGCSTGPSSILLKTIGIHKADILDSDDDEISD